MGGDVQIESIPVDETWARLKRDADAVLIDVRTIAEWAYVGLPDLSSINKQPVLVEWQSFPDDRLNAAFVDRVAERSFPSAQSRQRAAFHLSLGRPEPQGCASDGGGGLCRCRNVADGFEGPLDADRRRGRLAGWKARGLPWVQG